MGRGVVCVLTNSTANHSFVYTTISAVVTALQLLVCGQRLLSVASSHAGTCYHNISVLLTEKAFSVG